MLMNDAQSANIFWIVEGAVSMGASTHMEGTDTRRLHDHIGCRYNLMNGRLLAGSRCTVPSHWTRRQYQW